jgi:ferredoxin
MPVLANFKLPPLGGEAIVGNREIQQLMNASAHVKPKADPELCTACGACIEHCPVAALAMEEAIPAGDAEVCIACFCCQEICPEKAIRLN